MSAERHEGPEVRKGFRGLEIEVIEGGEITRRGRDGTVLERRKAPPTVAATYAPLEIGEIRELTEEDIESALQNGRVVFRNRVRTNHHTVAKLLAQGYKPSQAAAIVGMTPLSISLLKNSPQFQELLAYYQANTFDTLDISDRMKAIAHDGLDRIQQKITEDESLKLEDIHKVTMDLIESAGLKAPARSEVRSYNVHGRLEELKKERADGAQIVDRAKLAKELQAHTQGEGTEVGRIEQSDTLLGLEGPTEEGGEADRAEVREEGARRVGEETAEIDSPGEPVD